MLRLVAYDISNPRTLRRAATTSSCRRRARAASATGTV